MTSDPKIKFFLQRGNRFLKDTNEFTAAHFREPGIVAFLSEDAALDKASEMGIHLDRVQVVRAKNIPDPK